MAKEIIWSPRAISSFDRIIKYLEKEWTEREIRKLISNTDKVLYQIQSEGVKFRGSGKKDIHEVLITKHNLLLYRTRKSCIELLLFYDTRQHPKKKIVK